MDINTHNDTYVGGKPTAIGDRRWSQDIFRDFRAIQQMIGEVYSNLLGQTGLIFSGGEVTQGAGHTLNITACKALIQFAVTVPNSWASIPPTTQTKNNWIPTNLPAQTNWALSATTNDGVTANYLKLAYAETPTSSRSRAELAGSYNSELIPAYTLTATSVAPTAYEIELCRFTTDGATVTFTGYNIDNRKRNPRSNTIVIASSNSEDSSKNMADAIIPIADDAGIIINRYIGALGSGGTIKLLEGTYNVETIIDLEDDITLSGQGASTLLFLNAAIAYVIRINAKDNCVVDNLQIDGDSAGIPIFGTGATTYAVIKNCTVINGLVECIKFDGGTYTSIKNNIITGSTSSGIRLWAGSDYSTVSGNDLNSNANYGLQCSGDFCKALDNRCDLNTVGGMFFDGASHNNICSGNYVSNSGDDGFAFEGDYNTITGNYAYTCANDGFYINSSNFDTISGNVVTGCDYGIRLVNSDNNTICNNSLEGNTTDAVNFSATADNNICQNNKTVAGAGASDITNNGAGNSVQGNY